MISFVNVRTPKAGASARFRDRSGQCRADGRAGTATRNTVGSGAGTWEGTSRRSPWRGSSTIIVSSSRHRAIAKGQVHNILLFEKTITLMYLLLENIKINEGTNNDRSC